MPKTKGKKEEFNVLLAKKCIRGQSLLREHMGQCHWKTLSFFLDFQIKGTKRAQKILKIKQHLYNFKYFNFKLLMFFSSREEVGSNNFYYSDLSNGFFLFMQRCSVSTIFYSPACAYREITIFPVHIIKKGVVTSTQGKKNDIGYFALEQMLRRRHFRYLRD